MTAFDLCFWDAGFYSAGHFFLTNFPEGQSEMRNLTRQVMAWAFLSLLVLAGSAQAALYTRSGGMVYDDVLDITWLADWNYANTSGYDSLGAMQWPRAIAWAANLTFGGFDDWRLPTVPVACLIAPPAYDCAGNELGHMYYNNFGEREGGTMLGAPNTDELALFSNIQPYYYWTGADDLVGYVNAWAFAAGGYHIAAEKGYQFFAVAVRDGDVLSPVPEPNSFALALAALGILALAACSSRGRFRLGR